MKPVRQWLHRATLGLASFLIVPAMAQDSLNRTADAVRALSILGESGALPPPSETPRIVNGRSVDQAERNWKWTVSLQEVAPGALPQARGRHFCGGTIVEPNVTSSGTRRVIDGWQTNGRNVRWVLTAAHCVLKVRRNGQFQQDGNGSWKMRDADTLRVVSGTVNLQPAARITQTVLDIRVHSEFDPETMANDVALLLLGPQRGDAPRIDGIPTRPHGIQLARSQDAFWLYRPYSVAEINGWGKLAERGRIHDTLQQVRVPVVDAQTCRAAYRTIGGRAPHATAFCAGYSTGGYDSCQGDSGGPVFYSPPDTPAGIQSSIPQLLGIVSWGYGCARPGAFGVYTNVLHVIDWITETILSEPT